MLGICLSTIDLVITSKLWNSFHSKKHVSAYSLLPKRQAAEVDMHY